MYYKICRNVGGKLYSFSFSIMSEYSIEYKLNEFVYGSNGQFLFIFDSLENAKNYLCYLYANEDIDSICQSNGFVFFECEAVGVETRKPITQHNIVPNSPPKGTVYAYGVKLVKKVKL